MSRCLIHIGMHKTGSSSIQRTLFRAHSLTGGHYVHAGQANGSMALVTSFKANPTEYRAHRRHARSAEDIRQQREQSLAALAAAFDVPSPLYVLSAEGLSHLDQSELERLRDWLLQRVERVECMGYVRDPKGFVESAFAQRLKGGGKAHWDLETSFPRYRRNFEKFDLVFGADNVRLRRFAPDTFPQRCVVRDFCEQAGLGLDPHEVRRTNESLPQVGLGLLYLYLRHGPGFGPGTRAHQEARWLVKALSEAPGPKFRLSRAALKPLIRRHRDDLDWMEARLGEPLWPPARDKSDAISSEDELMNSALGTEWLCQRLTMPCPTAPPGPEVIAGWVHRLRQACQASSDAKQHQRSERLARRAASSGDGGAPGPATAAAFQDTPEGDDRS